MKWYIIYINVSAVQRIDLTTVGICDTIIPIMLTVPTSQAPALDSNQPLRCIGSADDDRGVFVVRDLEQDDSGEEDD